MAGGTVSRTPHFVLHRAPLAAPSAPEAPSPTTGTAPGGKAASGARLRPLFAAAGEPWVGAVVPKRWAKRAVTRNGIRRQIYAVSESYAARLPAAAHVVRLRTDFARAQFPSAWSDALKAAVRGELLQLFDKVARGVAAQPPAAVAAPAPTVVPAQAGSGSAS